MFWKKKNKKEESPISNIPSDPRESFRVSPDPDEPVTIEINARERDIIDISSGGFTIASRDLELDNPLEATLFLPPNLKPISVKFKPVRFEEDEETCHCIFVDLPVQYQDEIHKYVLLRQKEDLHSGN